MSARNEGPRVLSFESRRQSEMATLIRRCGGQPTVSASMQEIRIEENPEASGFVEALRDQAVDTVVFLTGVGAETLAKAVAAECPREELIGLLGRCVVVTRGPKPTAVLRKWGLRVDGRAAEPNTWEQVILELERLDAVSNRTVAVQEYGISNPALYDWIIERGGRVMPVPVYRWGLPDDTAPLEAGIRDTVAGHFEVLLFTSAHQLTNVLAVAERLELDVAWKRAANECLLGSVGPTTSAALRLAGLRVDIEPTRPKMGALVREALTAAISRTRPPSSREAP